MYPCALGHTYTLTHYTQLTNGTFAVLYRCSVCELGLPIIANEDFANDLSDKLANDFNEMLKGHEH